MTTRYEAGRRYEHTVRTQLTNDGYRVIRSAGSKTKIDLIALKPGQVLFIQCKRSNGQIPPAERAALLEAAHMVGAIPLVAHQPILRRPTQYRRLTGPGPNDWEPWTPDEVGAPIR